MSLVRRRWIAHCSSLLVVAMTLVACGARSELFVASPMDAQVDVPRWSDARSDVYDALDVVDASDAGVDTGSAPDVAVPDPPTKVSVGLGPTVCVLRTSGHVDCWGGRQYSFGLAPGRRIDGIDDAIDVCAGWHFACALRPSGRVACWGANFAGQLGDRSRIARDDARDVEGVDAVVELRCSTATVCVRDVRGAIRCWGREWPGETVTEPLRSIELPGPAAAFHLTGATGCAASGQSVACWGGFYVRSIPLEFRYTGVRAEVLPFVNGVPRIAGAPVWGSTCVGSVDRNWWCQGACLGLPSAGADCRGEPAVLPFAEMRNTSEFVTMALATNAGCGLTATGAMHCWGGDPTVGVGNGTRAISTTPVPLRWPEPVLQVSAGSGFTALSGGDEHPLTCFIAASRRLYCWGFAPLGDFSETWVSPRRVILSGGD